MRTPYIQSYRPGGKGRVEKCSEYRILFDSSVQAANCQCDSQIVSAGIMCDEALNGHYIPSEISWIKYNSLRLCDVFTFSSVKD